MQFSRFINKSISRLYGASNIVDAFEIQTGPMIYWSYIHSKSVYKFPKTQYKKLYKAIKIIFSLILIIYFIVAPTERKIYLNSLDSPTTVEESYVLTPNQLRFAKLLPFQMYSKFSGYMMKIYVPTFARNYLYSSFLNLVGGNLDEVEKPLVEYKNINAFFIRHLKPNSRDYDLTKGVINSPVDGRVLYQGVVHNFTGEPQLEQIKGVHFSLKQFLGYIPQTKNPLYYYIIYLSPADYHRVHSPYNWTVNTCTHFPGYLFSVHPLVVSKVRGLFSINERVVMEGSYSDNKYFSMSLVGASGVGSIIINDLDQLKTNNYYWFKNNQKYYFNKNFTVGNEVGRFELGSTVVLLFEGEGFKFNVNPGDKVRLGQNIGQIYGY